jgi:hypothetical protein
MCGHKDIEICIIRDRGSVHTLLQFKNYHSDVDNYRQSTLIKKDKLKPHSFSEDFTYAASETESVY